MHDITEGERPFSWPIRVYWEDTDAGGVVYHAGYPEKERVVKGSLRDIMDKLSGEKEKWMGMIIVGKALTDQPFALLEQ